MIYQPRLPVKLASTGARGYDVVFPKPEVHRFRKPLTFRIDDDVFKSIRGIAVQATALARVAHLASGLFLLDNRLNIKAEGFEPAPLLPKRG